MMKLIWDNSMTITELSRLNNVPYAHIKYIIKRDGRKYRTDSHQKYIEDFQARKAGINNDQGMTWDGVSVYL